jgi:hypothetical protein
MHSNINLQSNFSKGLERLWSENDCQNNASVLYNFFKAQKVNEQLLNFAVEKQFMTLIRQGKVDAGFAYASIQAKLDAIDAALTNEAIPDSKCAIISSLIAGFVSAILASMPMFLGSLSTAPAYNTLFRNQQIAEDLANSFPVAIFTVLGLTTMFLSGNLKNTGKVFTRLKNNFHGTSNYQHSIAIIMCTVLGAVTTGYMAVVSSTAARNAAPGVLDYLSKALGGKDPSEAMKRSTADAFGAGSLVANCLLGLPSNVDTFLRLSTDLRGLSFCHKDITPHAFLSLVNYCATFALVIATSCWGYLPSAGYGPTSSSSTLAAAVAKNFGNISLFSSKLAAMLEKLVLRQSNLVGKPSIGCAFISIITIVFTVFLTMAFVGYGLIQQPKPGNHSASRLQSLGYTNSSTPLYPRQGLAGVSIDAYVCMTLVTTFPILFSMIFGAIGDISIKFRRLYRSPRGPLNDASINYADGESDPLLPDV